MANVFSDAPRAGTVKRRKRPAPISVTGSRCIHPAAWPARLTLTLRDGARFQDASDYPRGTPENPIDRRALETKFSALVGDRFGIEFAARSLAAASHLASRSNLSETFGTVFSVLARELTV